MAKIFLLPRYKNVRKYLVFKVTYAGSSPSCDCALSSGLVLLTLGWERDGLDPVIEDQGLLKMEEADVVADGVGVIVGMANDLLQVPGLLFLLKGIQLNSSGNNMHGQGKLRLSNK